ncbi:MAG TPA: AAA family ATPase, partial [Methylophaga sp.]|nr:AAA family ATPase [Methylophaga sp.]
MHATAEPAYLDRLALHSNPFSRQNLPGAFFAGRQTSQRLNLILHLLRSSSQISVLIAPDGYGKSILLSALQQRGGEDLRFCLIHASDSTNLLQVTQQCLQAFGATGDSQLGGDQQQLLRQRLQQLLQIQITPVLLIDDAGQLDASIQQQLATWLHWQHEGHYLLRAVMTSNKASALSNLRNERFQDLDLLPLADDEIQGYLQQRLQAAGWQDDLPFSDKQLQRILRRSKGVPAEINHQAHQSLLMGGGNKKSLLPNFPALNLPHWSRWLPVLPVVLVLALILIFQQNINDWLNQSRDDSDVAVTEMPAEAELPMVVVEDETVTSNAQAEKQNLIELLEELEDERAPQSDTPSTEQTTLNNQAVESEAQETTLNNQAVETETQKTTINKQAAETEAQQTTANNQTAETEAQQTGEQPAEPIIPPFTPLDEMPVENEKTTEPATETVAPTVTAPTNAVSDTSKSNNNEAFGAEWIMQQAKSAYTFQMMGSWERSEIDDYIKKYALTGDVAVFASMRNNKVWYALIYGVYDSKSAALNASRQWPSPLNSVSTWLR